MQYLIFLEERGSEKDSGKERQKIEENEREESERGDGREKREGGWDQNYRLLFYLG